MADIIAVADIISRMVSGFESKVMDCLAENTDMAVQAIHEQLWGGLDGNDHTLSPDYSDDPFFNEPGRWYHQNDAYIGWKASITPPTSGWMLNIPPRSLKIPNLFIDGTFYDTITAKMDGDKLSITAPGEDSAEIVAKWGDQILKLGGEATAYFCHDLIAPYVWNFFEECGW